jgi:hypothetical protein
VTDGCNRHQLCPGHAWSCFESGKRPSRHSLPLVTARAPPMFEKTDWIGLMKCAGNTNALHKCQSSLSRCFEMRKIDSSAPWGVPGATVLVAVCFQEWCVPVLVSLDAPAKSFVLRRWSNFYFSRPHKLLRYFPATVRLPTKAVPRHKARCAAAHSTSRISNHRSPIRTVLQLGFAVQSSGKKRCGRRVGELRKVRA